MGTICFLVGALVMAPFAFALGIIRERDRLVTHEPADIGPALRRSAR